MLWVKDLDPTADSSCFAHQLLHRELPLRPNTGPHCINSLLMIADSRFLLQPAYTQCHFTLLCNSDPGGGLLWIVKSHGLVTVLSTPLPFFGDSLGQFLWVSQLGLLLTPHPWLVTIEICTVTCAFWNGMSTPPPFLPCRSPWLLTFSTAQFPKPSLTNPVLWLRVLSPHLLTLFRIIPSL